MSKVYFLFNFFYLFCSAHDQFKFGTEEDVSEDLVDEKREKPYTVTPHSQSMCVWPFGVVFKRIHTKNLFFRYHMIAEKLH